LASVDCHHQQSMATRCVF